MICTIEVMLPFAEQNFLHALADETTSDRILRVKMSIRVLSVMLPAQIKPPAVSIFFLEFNAKHRSHANYS